MGRFRDTINNMRHANENAQKLQLAEKENGMLKAGLVVGGVSFLITGIECVRVRIALSSTRKELKNAKEAHAGNSELCNQNTADIEMIKELLKKQGIIIPDQQQDQTDFSEV